jgi:uncharacterized protein (DUF885 family)
MKRRFAVALAFAALIAPATALPKEPPPNKALHAFFEREFQNGLAEAPEFATFVGVEEFNDRLSDLSPAAVARRKARVKKAIRELEAFDPRRLGDQDRLSRSMMLDDLRRRETLNALYGGLPFGAGFIDTWTVLSPLRGPQHFYPLLAKMAPFRHATDYERYLKRLEAMPAALEQMTARMRAGMKSGWVPARAAMDRVSAQFEPFLREDVTASPLWAPFAAFPAAVAAEDRARLESAARAVLSGRVQPAFAAMRRFLESEYLPACRRELGASTLPGGARYYALLAASATTTSLSPKEIHDIGKQEVARIRQEMDKVIASTGRGGNPAEFARSIEKDPQFYFTKPEEMLVAYRDIAKRVDAELPRLFAELPRLPYGIRAMEAYEGANAEHYSRGALDGSRAGFFEANVLSLSSRPKYGMENTFLHEAVPGHHLQTARAQELRNLPRFRRAGFSVAYGEGWALYAESLGADLGLYRDPYSLFGRLSWEMVRACRLVIDTGIHAFGWTREDAIRYLVENSGIHEDFAVAEIDRYITDPSQALGYKIGELKIKSLRDRARAALGDRFDIRRFHNALLDDGALPLTVLEARIDEWIARERHAAAKEKKT